MSMDPVGNVRDFFGCILRYVYEFRIPLDRQRRTINLSALYNKYVLLHDNLCPISSSLSNFIQETSLRMEIFPWIRLSATYLEVKKLGITVLSV